MNILSDEELMEQVKQKNIEAYNQLYTRHAHKTYRFIFLYIRQKQAAEDILQETFIRVHVKSCSYNRAKSSFRTWLHQIAHRLCIDYYRKHSKEKWQKMPHEYWEAACVSEENRIQDKLLLQQYLGQLQDKERSILILAYYQGFTGREISEILNIPEGTVKSKLHYSLKKLNKQLKKELSDE
ncbi:RNA polymerase sigma factor [Bacillus velezensis]|uniref:RNA polymerase sigma factor n=1 Tax=Bacillus velezensis TaxID=492670 RepID=UPI00156B0AB5|nr:RNA polymerase sigma factor [Bacillus velezensis]NRR26436.1 RNA polymerase sigma factor [Bacillus velezensis]